MAFDAGMAMAVTHELSETLVGAKIEKIYQPSNDEIVLLCRGRGGSRKLLLSASASGARVSITAESKENPKTPPMFCMMILRLMRKKCLSAHMLFLIQLKDIHIMYMRL